MRGRWVLIPELVGALVAAAPIPLLYGGLCPSHCLPDLEQPPPPQAFLTLQVALPAWDGPRLATCAGTAAGRQSGLAENSGLPDSVAHVTGFFGTSGGRAEGACPHSATGPPHPLPSLAPSCCHLLNARVPPEFFPHPSETLWAGAEAGPGPVTGASSSPVSGFLSL